LASAIELLATEAGGLAFNAYWAGETPKARARVPLRELLRDVRANQVKNGTVYLVGKAV
jgi:hypothetical protein